MAVFTFSVFIDRSPHDVFDLLSNPGNCQQWIPPMQSAAWTSNGGPGVASTGRGAIKMAGQDAELQLKVTGWEPPKRYGLKIINVQLPFETTEYMYTLTAEDGGTRVTLECESEWVGLP